MIKIKLQLAVFLVTISILSGICEETNAQPIELSSCDYSEVNSAILSAKPGDTILLPEDDVIWNTQLKITKGIILKGAGVDKTIIINGIESDEFLIHYDPDDYDANDPFRITGFTLDSNGKHGLRLGYGRPAPFTLQTKVRIDHNKFINSSDTDTAGQALWNEGTLYGVVDNNIFDGVDYPIRNTSGTAINDWWEHSPQNIFEHGSSYYLYYEDNVFTNMGPHGDGSDNTVANGQYSIRYVFRYNTITTTVPMYDVFELHGFQVDGGMDSCFGAEVYGNHVIAGNNHITLFKQRSGQSLVFFNSIESGGTPGNTAYTSSLCECPTNKSELKITQNSYWWGSRKNLNGDLLSASATGGLDCAGLTDIPQMGRDVFSDTSSPGITSGHKNDIPVTCTVGEAYWATEQSCTNLTGMVGQNPQNSISGTLYKCTESNTWEPYYTPYTYPHPLRTFGPVADSPQVPTNLKIIMMSN